MKFFINKWILPLIAGLFHIKKVTCIFKKYGYICIPKYYGIVLRKKKMFHSNAEL